MDFRATGDSNGLWTNEKHMSFLNQMEASFVRRMFQNDGSSLTCASGRNPPPLDRYLPDSAESTLDFKNMRRNRAEIHVKSEIGEKNVTSYVQSDKKTRRNSHRPDNATQDQLLQGKHEKVEPGPT
ncbi:uncharacterized protein LOC143883671 isoform X2 [Tasmannia lanceolata]|uniref:uncharacterized protein LOC143883671 isoform X2 n=1 Tax=Tasmannia lanceolata TaxID=3420 RepID=UPI0040640D16